jgi:hypothetical protein
VDSRNAPEVTSVGNWDHELARRVCHVDQHLRQRTIAFRQFLPVLSSLFDDLCVEKELCLRRVTHCQIIGCGAIYGTARYATYISLKHRTLHFFSRLLLLARTTLDIHGDWVFSTDCQRFRSHVLGLLMVFLIFQACLS